MLRFLKTTILGGILFLVPIVIFIAVIGKAFLLTDKLPQPIANFLPFATFGGIAVAPARPLRPPRLPTSPR